MRLLLLLVTVIIVKEAKGIAEVRHVTLQDDIAVMVQLTPGGSYIIHANVSKDVMYVVCQAHTQASEVTLSMKKTIQHETSKYGRDVGLLTVVNGIPNLTWYLYSNSTANTNVLVHLTYLYAGDPLPGGCNEEFNLENDLNLELVVQTTKTEVLFQWSNVGYTKNKRIYPQCEDKVYNAYLEYDVFVSYLEGGDFTEKTYFNAVRSMLTPKDITKHGTKLKTLYNEKGGKSVVTISSYNQQGVVYGIVVRNKHSGTRAAYIPVVTYACDIKNGDDCKHKDIAGIFFSTVGAVLGAFLCFFGHRYFKIENFIFGFLIFALVSYQVIALETDISLIGSLSLAVILGLVGGTLLLSFWWNCGIPIINVLFIGLVAGYIISCIVFYTPFANLSYWDLPFNYGATFACVILLVPVALLWFTRFLNIFSCSLVGSYGFVVALDTYLGSGMRYIALNAIRHGTDTEYVKVVVSGPFTLSEIALTVVWIALFLSGMIFQSIRERKKAPFPPCPRQLRLNRDLRTLLRTATQEREPLIRGENTATRYGTSNEVTASSAGEASEEEILNKPLEVM